jgi:chromosome segregation ATPase
MASRPEDIRAAMLLGLPTADLTHFKEVRESEEDEPRSEIEELKETVRELKAEIKSIKKSQRLDYEDIRNLFSAIEEIDRRREPGKTEIARAEKIERYLKARPDHKAAFETLKGHLQVDNVLLNQSIKTLMESSPGRYEIAKTPGDKRKRTLVMLPR